jgi:hypothetical protein
MSYVYAVFSSDYNLSMAGGLIAELKDLLASNFISFSFKHECNKVAHALAALGAEYGSEIDMVVDNLPSCIQPLIAADCTVHE